MGPFSPSRNQPAVVIVGAGFGGVALAIRLLRDGFRDFVVLEQAADLGGVWRENTYPGAACDVPSPLYSYSFERNLRWPRRYAEQPAIHEYLRNTASKYGVLQHIRFNTEVAKAEFDESRARWELVTTEGERFSTRSFVPATGQLSRPVLPAIPGIDTFTGHSFHSANWDHDYDLSGKRVAVIGTGASAIQFVPTVQAKARNLALFQRSAPYIMPRHDTQYQPWHHKAFKIAPFLQTADRMGFWLYAEFAQKCMSKWHAFLPLFKRRAMNNLRRHVPQPELQKKLTPDYELGCKRILFSNDYYPALTQPNVDVVTDRISEITENGVRTEDDSERVVDVIIYGTGFASQDLLVPMEITGRGGRSLAEPWAEGARAHLGITVPQFPNMFLMYGPNTNLGGGSVIYMLESQARYIADAVHKLADRPGHYLDVNPEAEHAWDTEVQERLADSVWTQCSSWYRNEHGRVVSNWPGRTAEYRHRTRRVDLSEYRVGVATAAEVPTSPDREPSRVD